ncbi:uncharacterized protein METZ01_LOCUS133243 [marine metagenome]|uniref:Short-chain dehydrogenase n=1 Tax=marine metagenome TaxID=408172 RepID=A0A381YTU1_9ZZZZ
MAKNIIITGTSSGIGYELVKIFSTKGHNVIALSRNILPTNDLRLSNVYSISFDINNNSDHKVLIEYISKNWKHVDVLINNAGVLINKPFSETTTEDFNKVYSTNVFGVAAIINNILPFAKKGSHVINISSVGGVQGSAKFSGLSAYSSSKGALITLTELLAEEYKNSGIFFNVLALGAVQTKMLEKAFPGYKAPCSAGEMAEYIYNFSLNTNSLSNGGVVLVSDITPKR